MTPLPNDTVTQAALSNRPDIIRPKKVNHTWIHFKFTLLKLFAYWINIVLISAGLLAVVGFLYFIITSIWRIF